MRKHILPIVVVLLALGVALPGSAPQRDGVVLLRIDRQQSRVPASELLAEIEGVRELQSGWLATVGAAAADRLRAAGVAFSILDPAAGGKRYVLVLARSRGTGPEAALPGAAVWQLEESVWLVRADADDLRAKLPVHLALDPLSFSPQSLVRLDFDTPARGDRAVPRARSAAPLPFDARIADAVARVSKDRLSATIRDLESFQSRYATTSSLMAAANYLADAFRAIGLQTEYEDFTFTTSNLPASNIVATLRGRTSPQDVLIIGAHYDSTSNQRPLLAPGADDNASGTAAVVEAARVMAAVPFDFSVRFVAFSAEEQGLYGSRHHAERARAAGERIIGVINLDMIGYADRVPEDLDVLANPASEWLAKRFAAAAETYAPLPLGTGVNASVRSSDHAPFWDQGYSAVLGIEDLPLTNPYYHQISDRFETLNMDFATAVTKAAVATAASLAQPTNALAPPTNVQVRVEVIRSLFGRVKRHLLTWTPPFGASASHVYRSTTSHGPYVRVNKDAVVTFYYGSPGREYVDEFFQGDAPVYYVVTGVDSRGGESNYSAEVSTR